MFFLKMIRLYSPHVLNVNDTFALPEESHHYLTRVRRLNCEDTFILFNETSGAWAAEITSITRKETWVKLLSCVELPQRTEERWLAFGILKQESLTFLIEKATELCVTHLQPLITERCNVRSVNAVRLTKIATEAAQQCERHDIPKILPALPLYSFLKELPKHISWFVALERYAGKTFQKQEGAAGFIVGPEGGFTAQEQAALSALLCVKLGKTILRAETAALTLLAKQL